MTGSPMLEALHHVQLAKPEGGEAAARAFYGLLSGLPEVPKPASLQGRGGAWCERGSLRLHLAAAAPFTPARKAHSAFQVRGLAALADRLQKAGHPPRAEIDLPGMVRLYVDDPFGNRLELLELIG